MRPSQLLLALLAASVWARADAPSGKIAFPRDGAICLLDLASGKERELVKGLNHDRPVEWSPDGTHLLYSKHGQSGWDLWIVRAADGDAKDPPRNLTNVTAGGARSGAWSTDGKRIAYMRDQPHGLHVIDPDGNNPKRLTQDGFRDHPPAWSPDGKWLVYQEFGFVDESARAESKFKIELFAVAADGSKKDKLAPNEGSSDSASYSPRGDKLLYRGTRGQSGEICTLDLATGHETILTKTPQEEHAPAWSPDGAKIAFWRDTDQGPELWTMTANGADPKKLTTLKSGTRVDRPQWSPDGKWIAYGGADPADGVWITPTTPGQPKRLANAAGAHARWQPAPAK